MTTDQRPIEVIDQPAAVLLARAEVPETRRKARPGTGIAILRDHAQKGGPPRPYWIVGQQSRRAATAPLTPWAASFQAAFGGRMLSFRARLFGAAPLRLTEPVAWRAFHDAARAVLAGLPDSGDPSFDATVDLSVSHERLQVGVYVWRDRGKGYPQLDRDQAAAKAVRRALETYVPNVRDWFSGFGAAGLRLSFPGPMSAHVRAAALRDAAQHVAPTAPPEPPGDSADRLAALLFKGTADRLRQSAAAAGVPPAELARRLALRLGTLAAE